MSHGLAILSWKEHLPSDEMPPRWMWHLDHEIVAWFDKLDDEKGRGSDDADLTQNELTAHLRKR